ncbi:hypothetical protein M9194_12510 [Vibrio sp. S4M6]|uniref:hypothetical protein n=1 Tax=Vibrio sinus TaxID=2946865 RepID=UPI00202A5F31|nr:hypothetical protein [Vibrio sinus]MCL9782250.1 hypothetical protein [Vibrio sinus]
MKTKFLAYSLAIASTLFSLSVFAQQPDETQQIANLKKQVHHLNREVRDLNQRIEFLEAQIGTNQVHHSAYICTISIFGKTYQGESFNHAKATLEAMNKCRAKNNNMFCTQNTVTCDKIS